MNDSKGFTLIELLVVIAIIGILASVILAALGSARTKGYDASIKADVSNAIPQTELFYQANGNSYYGATAATQVCNSTALAGGQIGVYAFLLQAQKSFLPNAAAAPMIANGTAGSWNRSLCHADPDHWVMAAPLSNSTSSTSVTWCADSTGFSGVTTNVLVGPNYYACL